MALDDDDRENDGSGNDQDGSDGCPAALGLCPALPISLKVAHGLNPNLEEPSQEAQPYSEGGANLPLTG